MWDIIVGKDAVSVVPGQDIEVRLPERILTLAQLVREEKHHALTGVELAYSILQTVLQWRGRSLVHPDDEPVRDDQQLLVCLDGLHGNHDLFVHIPPDLDCAKSG